MEQKRVYCLYRVSTIGQVEKDDIPMQKASCRDFIEHRPDWVLAKEFYEKGVSGFKISAKDRDAVQEIQRDAVAKKFDVLLVFMFDRLGRKDDETPFVVEWFVQNGIEVWSVNEGQQRFDNHVDKLLNYIRYWQASGESIKTSVRTKTRMEQLTTEGHFTGGSVPYGYKLEQLGRRNKKNKPVYDIVIDEPAAEIVRLIFYKYVCEGMGAQRISRYFLDMKIKRPDGSNFSNITINHMLKRRLYTDYIYNGDAHSAHIPELQIIDQETFDKAQELMKGRTRGHSEVALNLKGKALLVGKVFCAHCGNRLTLTTAGKKRIRANGECYYQPKGRYQCHYRVRHPDQCNGQSGYGLEKLDRMVEEIVRYQLGKIQTEAGADVIAEQHERVVNLADAKYQTARSRLDSKKQELADFQNETIRVIRGQSKLNVELLNDLIARTTKEITEISVEVEAARVEYEESKASTYREQTELTKLQTWADLYDNCTFEAKKMLISQFIKSIHVHRDYSLDIEFNVSFAQFQSLQTGCVSHGNEKASVYVI